MLYNMEYCFCHNYFFIPASCLPSHQWLQEGAQQSEVRSESLEATFNSSQNISVLPTLFKHTSETQCFDILLDWMTIQSVSYLLSVVNNVLECAYFSLGVKKEESYLLNYWGLLYLTNRIFLKDRSCVLKYKCYCVFTGIREYQEFILEHQTNLRNTAVDPGTSKSGCGR